MKRVIVTGATGFVGTYVVRALVAAGYDVVALAHSKICKNKFIKYEIVDISKKKEVDDLFRKYNNICGIIHLAANISMKMDDDQALYDTNCRGTQNLVNHTKQRALDFFIHLSSIGVIGTPKRIPIDETHPCTPKTYYHYTKLKAEDIVRSLKECNIRFYNIRIPSPIGVGMRENTFLSVVLKSAVENRSIKIYGEGSRVQSYIDVRDISNFLVKLIDECHYGLYVLASDQGISNIDLAKKCVKLTGSDSDITKGNGIDEEEGNCWKISFKKAKEELHFVPQYSLDDTIKWMIGEMR